MNDLIETKQGSQRKLGEAGEGERDGPEGRTVSLASFQRETHAGDVAEDGKEDIDCGQHSGGQEEALLARLSEE